MSLWNRRTPTDFRTKSQAPLGGPADVLTSNPTSQQFDEQGCDSPKALVNYMIALQKAKFDKTILDMFDYPTLLANAKRMKSFYGGAEVKRAIKKTVDISARPFSFKAVENTCLTQIKIKKG